MQRNLARCGQAIRLPVTAPGGAGPQDGVTPRGGGRHGSPGNHALATVARIHSPRSGPCRVAPPFALTVSGQHG